MHSLSRHDIIMSGSQCEKECSDMGTMSCTVWRVIFVGANFREKSKVAFRINFCGFNFRDYRPRN